MHGASAVLITHLHPSPILGFPEAAGDHFEACVALQCHFFVKPDRVLWDLFFFRVCFEDKHTHMPV